MTSAPNFAHLSKELSILLAINVVGVCMTKKTFRADNVIFVDSRERNQLPSTYLNDDTMKKDGNYYSDVEYGFCISLL